MNSMLPQSLQTWAQEMQSNTHVDTILQRQEERLQQLEHDLQQLLPLQQQPPDDSLSTWLSMEQWQQRTMMDLLVSTTVHKETTPARWCETNHHPSSSRPRPCPESLLYDSVLQDTANQQKEPIHRTRKEHNHHNPKQMVQEEEKKIQQQQQQRTENSIKIRQEQQAEKERKENSQLIQLQERELPEHRILQEQERAQQENTKVLRQQQQQKRELLEQTLILQIRELPENRILQQQQKEEPPQPRELHEKMILQQQQQRELPENKILQQQQQQEQQKELYETMILQRRKELEAALQQETMTFAETKGVAPQQEHASHRDEFDDQDTKKKRAPSIQVALQQLDESMASVLLTTTTNTSHYLNKSNTSTTSRSHSRSNDSASTVSSGSTTSDMPSTVMASRWNVAEDDSAMYCPTVKMPSSSNNPNHTNHPPPPSSTRRPSNIHVWPEEEGDNDDDDMSRNHVDNQLTMDEGDDEDDGDHLNHLPTRGLDQRYHLEQDSSLPHGFRVVPNVTTPSHASTHAGNQTHTHSAKTKLHTPATNTDTTTAHPNVSARKPKLKSPPLMTPMRLLQQEMQQQQHNQEATLLLHQTLSSSHLHHDDASEYSSATSNNCSLFQDNSRSWIQDPSHTQLPLITKQEYSIAPRIVQMQIGWHEMNHAIQIWNQAQIATPLAYADALNVWGQDETHNRVLLMSLCHFRRLWLKPQDGQMWFDVCL